jgi:hypothetical protein
MDVKELWKGVDWIHVAQDGPVKGTCEHDNEPSSRIEFWEFLNIVQLFT